MGPRQLETLFNPKSIAVFGASESSRSVGAKVYSNLLAGGFEGLIVPINPKHKQVRGKACFSSIADIKYDVDLAIIATPAATVPDINPLALSRSVVSHIKALLD